MIYIHVYYNDIKIIHMVFHMCTSRRTMFNVRRTLYVYCYNYNIVRRTWVSASMCICVCACVRTTYAVRIYMSVCVWCIHMYYNCIKIRHIVHSTFTSTRTLYDVQCRTCCVYMCVYVFVCVCGSVCECVFVYICMSVSACVCVAHCATQCAYVYLWLYVSVCVWVCDENVCMGGKKATTTLQIW